MPIKNALASLAVSDLERALSWYERLFDRAPDARPMPDLAEWQFSRGGWLQIYRLPERAGQGSVTFAVDDLEAIAARLHALGSGGGEHRTGPQVTTLMVTDPDGNHLAFAQALDPLLIR